MATEVSNEQLEMKVIGMILLYPDLYKNHEIEEKIFFSSKAKNIIQSINRLYDENKDFTDLELLRSRGVENTALKEAMDIQIVSKSHFRQDIEEINRLYLYRNALSKLEEATNLAKEMPVDTSEFINKIDGMVSDILGEFKTSKSPYIKDVIQRLEQYREDYRQNKDEIVFNTGIDKLDNLTGGFIPNSIFIVGGWTGVSKTWFALQLLLNALKQKKKCLLFSLEMSDIMNAARMVGNISNKAALEIFQGASDEIITDQINWMNKQSLIVYDDKLSIDSIKNTAKKHAILEGIDFIVIDYVQNVQGDGSLSNYELMSKVANTANVIAQETGAAILLVSQISQGEMMRSKKGGVVTYKGAGELAAGPDVGLYLERLIDENDETVPDRTLCRVVKSRHGATGKVFLKFDPTSGFIKEDVNQEL